MNKTKIQEQITKKETEIKNLKKDLRESEEKDDLLEIKELGIKITTNLRFKGKTYPEILKEVNESEIADYPLLQKLRNEGFKSSWKKYAFLKDTWAFVPNPDEVSKSNDYVAGFDVGSGYADLGCYWDSDYSGSTLGVFLVKPIKKKK